MLIPLASHRCDDSMTRYQSRGAYRLPRLNVLSCANFVIMWCIFTLHPHFNRIVIRAFVLCSGGQHVLLVTFLSYP
ncbi:hypothetical protein F4604DRAFT_1753660 [Suillus subluteus]|nr:hypothetical protein F4604DRAFT_1753660 [Suillus subluteus]